MALISRSTLETERLLLEPVSAAHAKGLFDATVASRSELLPWMPWAREPSLEEGLEQARRSESEWAGGREFHFALVDRESGRVLGVVGLNIEGEAAAELHYWIRSDHAGSGRTTEACQKLVDLARRVLKLRRLTLWAGRENHASRRVAEKLGFEHVGPLSWQPEGGQGTFPAESYELVL